MSFAASIAAWSATVQGLDKLVLLCLADHANSEGRCWPSIARIGKRCGLHRASVMRSLQHLETGGIIEIERGRGQLNRYIMKIPKAETSSSQQPVANSDRLPVATSSTERPVANSDATSRSPRRDQSLIARPPVANSDPNLPRTYHQPTKNLARRSRTKAAPHKAPPFHREVINAFHEICPSLPEVKVWTDQRRKALDARISERLAAGKPADTIGYWRSVFDQVATSAFLLGQATDFRADLPWLLKPENFAKTIEGRYSANRPTNGGHLRA